VCWWWWWRVVSDVETETETHTSRELPVSRIHRPTRNLIGFPAFLYFRDIFAFLIRSRSFAASLFVAAAAVRPSEQE